MDTNVTNWMSPVDGLPSWASDGRILSSWKASLPTHHVHIVPSLSLGGAERIVTDIARSLSESGATADVVVMRNSEAEHALEAAGIGVHRLGSLPWPERIAYCAGLVRASRLPAYCHLTSLDELRKLWTHGVRTVPVVHNVREGWKEDPSSWNVLPVPFVVACGDQVARNLAASGLEKPIRVLRHVVHGHEPMSATRRQAVRQAFGADAGTLLVGMTGRHVAQKRYVHAVRILAQLRQDGVDARLAIVGAIPGQEGMLCHEATAREALRLGVRDYLVFAGPIRDAGSLVEAYDVFLNTSLWEGVSISTMEAVAAGVPVVASDVGGQREAVGSTDILLSGSAEIRTWADAVASVSSRARTMDLASSETIRLAAAAAWPGMLQHGPGSMPIGSGKPCDILFVTGNMDVGGAQRSLCNLVAELPAMGVRPVVAVCGPVGVPGFMQQAMEAGVEFLDLSGAGGRMGGLRGRSGRVLCLAAERNPSTLCFWNMDALTKMVVAKVMQGGPVRLADVSPGPMLYKELHAADRDAMCLSTGTEDYIASLDVLVSKYKGGLPPAGGPHARHETIVPNGVPQPVKGLPAGEGPCPPLGCDPSLAVVTVGRLVAAKRPELLPLVAAELGRMVPGATLTVVGGTHGTDPDGSWTTMLDACAGVLPPNLHFAGPDDRTMGFLPRFAAFYMVSRDQGCPNASLEAMACGLPIVANPDGGTAEQVRNGVNGFLVADTQEAASYARLLASTLAGLLHDPVRASAMGSAGQERARAHFSMPAMANSYMRTLLTP
jgi:glycosyltransferase involved in cell wall biosynthesis